MSSRPSRGAARLAAILDALPDALLLVNCNGTVVNANAIALEAFETPGTALVGRGLLDLLPEFDSKRIPGSMRRPDEEAELFERQRPTRMVARRTDGSEFPVEVTSANLEDGRTPYASAIDAAFADPGPNLGYGPGGAGYTGDELLMLVVRDLTGTLDTEAELARQQRQTEMILRAASEGVVGVDTEGRVVLVNPAAAQILGYRAGDLGGQELHPLVHHSRPDGTPLPFAETPLSDTLKSGRKHRVKVGQTLWAKDGRPVPVDMTTAPVRDGDQLVGAVLAFTDRRAYEALTARNDHLTALLGDALRGPLERLRGELTGLAEDPAGQLWPEANQVLHHLSAGYARMQALVDSVLRYQQLDAGREKLRREPVALDAVVANGVEGAIELIGPGRAQFAVHAPPIEAEVDAERLTTALAHLVADVAGVDATGTAPVAAPAGADSTIVVAAAKRGEVVRIEVRGPYGGGSPVHQPIVRGIVQRHGGVLQTHEVPGGGSAYVLEVPVTARGAGGTGASGRGRHGEPGDTDGTGGTDGTGSTGGAGGSSGNTGGSGGVGGGGSAGGADGADAALGMPPHPRRSHENETTMMPVPARPVRGTDGTLGHGGAQVATDTAAVGAWTGNGAPVGGADAGLDTSGASMALGDAAFADAAFPDAASAEQAEGEHSARPTGRRRRGPAEPESPQQQPGLPGQPGPPYEYAYEQQHEQAAPAGDGARRGALELPAGPSSDAAAFPEAPPNAPVPRQGTGRRARRALASGSAGRGDEAAPGDGGDADAGMVAPAGSEAEAQAAAEGGAGTGRRARRAARAESGGGAGQFALPPGAGGTGTTVDAAEAPRPAASGSGGGGGRRARRLARAQAQAQAQAIAPVQGDGPLPPEQAEAEAREATAGGPVDPRGMPFAAPPAPQPQLPQQAQRPEQPQAQAEAQPEEQAAQYGPFALPPGPSGADSAPPAAHAEAAEEQPAAEQPPASAAEHSVVAASPILGGGPPPPGADPHGAPGDAAAEADPQHHDPAAYEAGHDPRVRTLGQGVPFTQRFGEQTGGQPSYGRSPLPAPAIPSTPSTPAQQAGSGRRRKLSTPQHDGADAGANAGAADAPGAPAGQSAQQPLPPRQARGQQGQGPGPGGQAQGPAQANGARGMTPAREFSIGAPDAGADEGPEPLDGPDSPVEVSNGRGQPMHPPGAWGSAGAPGPMDDDLPPEPLDNPRRLLVWPEPDVSTQQALSDRGYRPVLVHSREEVDAQIAAYPAALFVDPLTGPITRTALQSLRTAAVAAEVPVLVTAGLGHATREAAYGADPAVLLKALAPRDSEQHPPRVLLVEEHEPIAGALAASLERRGMQVAHAPTDAEAIQAAEQTHPNLVVMDLMQVRRRRAGIIDWLRVNGLLNRTPFVVYTSADMDPAELPRLASGETVLFLAERSTNAEVQARIVDLLTKIGAH